MAQPFKKNTLNQDERGKRTQPHPKQWELIDNMVKRSLAETDVPAYDKIYLSRRAHANPLTDRKAVIGEDNTIKRGLTNEDEVVEILTELGYTEVFGENYTLAEKIALFSKMKKYIELLKEEIEGYKKEGGLDKEIEGLERALVIARDVEYNEFWIELDRLEDEVEKLKEEKGGVAK